MRSEEIVGFVCNADKIPLHFGCLYLLQRDISMSQLATPAASQGKSRPVSKANEYLPLKKGDAVLTAEGFFYAVATAA